MEPVRQRQVTYNAGTAENPVWKIVLLDFFVYEVPVFASLAAGASFTNRIIIQADADFEWIQSCYEFDVAAAAFTYSTRPMPNMSIRINDTGSGRQLMNDAVPVTSIFGQPENPYVLPISRTFKANATIEFTATNFDAAVATGNLRLSLIGFKQFFMN